MLDDAGLVAVAVVPADMIEVRVEPDVAVDPADAEPVPDDSTEPLLDVAAPVVVALAPVGVVCAGIVPALMMLDRMIAS